MLCFLNCKHIRCVLSKDIQISSLLQAFSSLYLPYLKWIAFLNEDAVHILIVSDTGLGNGVTGPFFFRNLQSSEEERQENEKLSVQHGNVNLKVSRKWPRALSNPELVLYQIQPPQGLYNKNKNKYSLLVGEVFQRCLF